MTVSKEVMDLIMADKCHYLETTDEDLLTVTDGERSQSLNVCRKWGKDGTTHVDFKIYIGIPDRENLEKEVDSLKDKLSKAKADNYRLKSGELQREKDKNEEYRRKIKHIRQTLKYLREEIK